MYINSIKRYKTLFPEDKAKADQKAKEEEETKKKEEEEKEKDNDKDKEEEKEEEITEEVLEEEFKKLNIEEEDDEGLWLQSNIESLVAYLLHLPYLVLFHHDLSNVISDEEEEEIVVTETTQNANNKEDPDGFGTSTITISNKAMMESFIAKLSNISNRDLVNEVIIGLWTILYGFRTRCFKDPMLVTFCIIYCCILGCTRVLFEVEH